MTVPRILAFSGSLKQQSYNQRMLVQAASAAANHGADVKTLRLNDYPMPLFSEDIEADQRPDEMLALKDLFRDAEGFLIASPEYNGSVTAALKNTLDWMSRPDGTESVQNVFAGKVAVIMSASPGGLGGLRGLTHLREILTNLGVIVLPSQYALGSAFNAFDDSGQFVSDDVAAKVDVLAQQVVEMTSKLGELK